MTYWLGIDCGGTFVKAALFNQQGKEQFMARRNVSVLSDQPGRAERDMGALWDICAEVIRALTEQVDTTQIQGIGISAQGKGCFLLDKYKQPLGRGILSSDQRALPIVKQWQADGIPEKLYPKTRQTLWTGHPVSILRALKEQEPDRYQKIGHVLMSHDYLRFCLTGEIAGEITNISESNLYNFDKGDYDAELAELLGISEIFAALPPIISATDIAGRISETAAAKTGLTVGTPVVGGLFDVVSTALCAGLESERVLNLVLGTWSVVTGITHTIDDAQTLPFVYGKSAQAGQYIVHEASPTSSANIEWLNTLTGEHDYARINAMVDSLPKGESSVFFLPFLYGSNAGLGMQAGFYGLQSYHDKAHLYQAVYEGVIFSAMTHLTRIEKRFPDVKTLRVTGGPAKSAVWMQMFADISDKAIEVPDIEETGCLGAAIVAMVGLGLYENTDSARKALSPDIKCYSPKVTAESYQKKYQHYQHLVSCLQQFNARQNA